jgi:hypothetical protein
MFIAQVLWATRIDLRKKMVWPLTVIHGVGKCATSRATLHEFEPLFFFCYASRHLALPFIPTLLSYPTDPDYKTHDKAPPKGRRPFLPLPLEVHEWVTAVTQGGLYAPCTGPSLLPPLRSAGRYVTPPPPPIAR